MSSQKLQVPYMSTISRELYAFGPYVFDGQTDTLSLGGVPVDIRSGLVRALLRTFLARPLEIIPHTELVQAVWGAKASLRDETNLHDLVPKLNRLLAGANSDL